MDCSKKNAVAGLPDDLLVEILARVPAKDLYRSKCVSRFWRDAIADPLHRRKLPQTLLGLFYGCIEANKGVGGGGGDGGVDSVGGEDDEDSDGFGDVGGYSDEGDSDQYRDGNFRGDYKQHEYDSEEEEEVIYEADEHKNWTGQHHGYGQFINLFGRSAPLIDASFPFLKELPGVDIIRLLCSCNGLLLFEHGSNSETLGFIVCNPATQQWMVVPCDTDQSDTVGHTFLIFDPAVSSHFRLVMFRDNMVHAYSSELGVWTHSESDWPICHQEYWGGWRPHIKIASMHIEVPNAAFHNGMLYLILSENQIAEVDAEGKTRRIIPAPSRGWYRNRVLFVGQSQGRLHCITEEQEADGILADLDSNDSEKLYIWVLEDYDSQEWELKYTVSRLHLLGESFTESGVDYDVVAIHPDSNLVFIVQHCNQQLISYGMDSKEVRVLGILEHGYRCFSAYVPCFSDFLSN